MKKLILILCCILAFSACDNKKEQNSNEKLVIKIGALYPMSGDGAVFGEAAKNAVDIFFEEFNQKPHKFEYQIVFEDNQNVLSKQATLAQKFINMDKVDVLISVLSNFGAVVSPLAEQSKTLHISTATDPSVAKGKYNIIASSNPQGEVDLLYDTLLKNKAKKVDVVIAQATGPEVMLEGLKQKEGLNIGQVYSVNINEKDFRLMLHKIKENKPDYIIALLAMPTIDIFMRQYHENQMNIPVTGIETFSYLQNKELAEGMWYVDAAPATDEYVKKYQQKTGSNTTNYAEYMDFMLQMVTFGYEKSGSTNGEDVANYLENNATGQKTAVGVISVEPDGVLIAQPVVKKVINGEPVIIEE